MAKKKDNPAPTKVVAHIDYNVQGVPYAQIELEEGFNAREDVGDVSGLETSIAQEGLTTPVAVVETASGFRLVEGFRRHAAIGNLIDQGKLPGDWLVKAKVYPENTSDAQLHLLNMVENTARQNLNPMEEAKGVQRLLDDGLDEEAIIAALGWSKTLLTQRIGLLALDPVIQEAVRDDRISVQQARLISELPPEEQPRFIDMAAELSTNRLRDEVNKLKEKLDNAANPSPADGDDDESGSSSDSGENDEGAAEDESEVKAAENLQQCQGFLADIAAFAVKDKPDPASDFSILYAGLRSVNLDALDSDSLESFQDALGTICSHLGCVDLAKNSYQMEAGEEEVADADGDTPIDLDALNDDGGEGDLEM